MFKSGAWARRVICRISSISVSSELSMTRGRLFFAMDDLLVERPHLWLERYVSLGLGRIKMSYEEGLDIPIRTTICILGILIFKQSTRTRTKKGGGKIYLVLLSLELQRDYPRQSDFHDIRFHLDNRSLFDSDKSCLICTNGVSSSSSIIIRLPYSFLIPIFETRWP